MKSSILCIILLFGVVLPAFAQNPELSSFITSTIDEKQLKNGTGFSVRQEPTPTQKWEFGHFDVSVTTEEWKAFAGSTKESIRSRLASAGWKIDLDMQAEPTGYIPFNVVIVASKDAQQLLLNMVIFLSEEGVVHVVYSVQSVAVGMKQGQKQEPGQ